MRGLVVSLNTPFRKDGEIACDAVERLVEWHVREGAIGFLVPAQAAEVGVLTLDERMNLVRTVRAASRGRALVIAGATAASERESFRLAEVAVDCGCDGVLSEPPPGAEADAPRLLNFFRTPVFRAAPLLMIQDLDWRGQGMPLPVILSLVDGLDNFRWLKVEVTPAGPKYSAVLAAAGGRLRVAGGWAALQMIEALDRGVDVFMNTAITGMYRAVIDAYDAGHRESACDLFYKMLPVLAFTRTHLDVSIHFHKLQFERLGIFPTARVRKQGLAWDEHHERQAQDLFRYLDEIQCK